MEATEGIDETTEAPTFRNTFRDLNEAEDRLVSVVEKVEADRGEPSNGELALRLFGEDVGLDLIEQFGPTMAKVFANVIEEMGGEPDAVPFGALTILMRGVELGRALERAEG